jgi:hypothetical protein
MGACRGPTRPRVTPAGDQSPVGGRSFEDGKSGEWNRHEGRTWETTDAPDGGKAPKWKSRERCREGTLPTRSGRDQTVRRVETRKTDRAEPQGPVRIAWTARAVETQNLRRAIVNGRSSRGDRCANTRRAGLTLRGTPIRMSDVRSVRRGRRKPLPSSDAKLTEGESRGSTGCRRSPQSLKAGPTAVRGADS